MFMSAHYEQTFLIGLPFHLTQKQAPCGAHTRSNKEMSSTEVVERLEFCNRVCHRMNRFQSSLIDEPGLLFCCRIFMSRPSILLRHYVSQVDSTIEWALPLKHLVWFDPNRHDSVRYYLNASDLFLSQRHLGKCLFSILLTENVKLLLYLNA